MTEDPLAPYVKDISDHMNQDHADALVLFCAAFAGVEITGPRMVHIDRDGFDIVGDEGSEPRRVRVPFPHPVKTPGDVRRTMVEMLKQARASHPTE